MVKMKISKLAAITFNSFLLSPIASIPFMFFQLWKKNDTGISFLVSIIIGFFSLRYIPNFSNDKVRYIERNELFSNYSLMDLFSYFGVVNRPDYIFDIFNFIFSKASIDIKYFFFFITLLSVFLTLTAAKSIVKSIANPSFSYSNVTFIIIILSFSVINVLSGLRFFLAGSVFLWFLYFLYFKGMYLKAFFVLFIAIATHFSYSLILIVTIIAFFNKDFRFPKLLLILSLVFFILPNTLITGFFSLISLPSGYIGKIDSYSSSDTVYTGSALILSLIRNIWYYFAIALMLIYKPSKNDIFYIFIIFLMAVVNTTFSLPVVFNRYVTYIRIIFSIYLIYLYSRYRGRKTLTFIFIFLLLFGLSIYTDLFIILRYNVEDSYSIETMWSIYNIITKDGDLYNYLY